eukprot:8152991-Pyramimonas_sp.AAC.1
MSEGLSILAVNGSGWGSAKRIIKSTNAHFVLVQEHKLQGQSLLEVQASMGKAGWISFREGGHNTGVGMPAGAAILVRGYLDAWQPS